MNKDSMVSSEGSDVQNLLEKTRDLSDFCLNWPHLRHVLTDPDRKEHASSAELIQWLVRLADTVCLDEL